MKTACIYHNVDLDGWMSAAIVKYYLLEEAIKNKSGFKSYNSVEETDFSISNVYTFIGYNYGQPIPDLSQYDKVIMCDISFPKEEMFKLKDKLIWLDHHISAIKDIEVNEFMAGNYKGLRDTKYAACELTWQYFFPNQEMPEIVRLLGRYDCFGHKGTNEEIEVLKFQYGARQCIGNYNDAYYYLKLTIIDSKYSTLDSKYNNLTPIYKRGEAIYFYLCTEAKQSYKNGFPIEFLKYISSSGETSPDKYKFICINKERFNPINFGIDYHKDGYDGAACFHFDGKQYNFSLYNDNGLVDVSQIAKQFGGGGHKGAAGFRIDNLNKILK